MYISTPNTATDSLSTFIEIAGTSLYDSALNIAGEGGSLKRWHSIIGIITAIVGNILISFALNIQRYAHIRLNHDKAEKERSRAVSRANATRNGSGNGPDVGCEGEEAEETDPLMKQTDAKRASTMKCDDDDHFEKTTYLNSPYWWAGITLMTIGEAGNFLAYGFAPASIVSPLGVVALISNCIIAPFMLNERFRIQDLCGVVIATGGAVTVVLSAKTQEKKLGPHEVWDAITRTEFEIYMGVTVGLIIILMWASPRFGYKTILIDLGLVGLFGGYTALSTKGVASMFSSTLWRAFTTPVSYALLAVLVGTAVMQVRYVNKALQRFDSTQVIPVQFVLFTLSVIMGSAILYRDFEQATVESVTKFAGGCLLTFLGVSFITSGRTSNEDQDVVDEEDEENIGLSRANLDGAVGDEIQWSRSSSISFADNPPPKTPQRFQSTGSGPEILLTKTQEIGSQDQESEPTPRRASPALPSRHYSSPVIPTEAHSSLLSVIGMTQASREIHRSQSQDSPHTHPNYQTANPPQPDPGLKDRPATPSRTSLSLIIPGPFSSPLSGGLSAVVADTLRKGVDSPLNTKSRRLSRSGAKSRSHDQEDIDNGPSPLRHVQTHEDVPRTSHGERSSQTTEENEPTTRSRARSLSNTLGDFLRGRRGKKDNSDGGRM